MRKSIKFNGKRIIYEATCVTLVNRPSDVHKHAYGYSINGRGYIIFTNDPNNEPLLVQPEAVLELVVGEIYPYGIEVRE